MLWFHGSEVSTRLNLQAIIDKSDKRNKRDDKRTDDKRTDDKRDDDKRDRRDVSDN
jgi:hypothetical protein